MIQEAVIFADSPHHFSKFHPLKKLAGLSVIARHIKIFERFGIKKIWIVVGPEKDTLSTHVEEIRTGADVHVIENTAWQELGLSGLSLLKGKVEGDFFAVRADVVYDKEVLKPLSAEAESADQGVAVLHEDHQTGLVVLTPRVFDGGMQADSLEELVSAGIGHQKFNTLAGDEFFFHKLETKKSWKLANNSLLRSCRKSTDGFISRNCNRYISLFFTRFLINAPFHANWYTLITSVIGMASGYYAWKGTGFDFIIAGILFNAASILDGVDGEMARLKFSDSKLGQWLDTFSDNSALVAFVVGTFWGLSKRTDIAYPEWLMPSAGIGLALLLFFMIIILKRYTESGSLVAIKQKLESLEGVNPFVGFVIKMNWAIRRDFFATLFMVLAFFDLPHGVVFCMALATHVAWVFLASLLVTGTLKNA